MPSPLDQNNLGQKLIAWIVLCMSAFKNSVISVSESIQDTCKYLLLCFLKYDDPSERQKEVYLIS